MEKNEKELVIADLTERLRSAEALIVADYRGLTNKQLVGLRARLYGHGATLQVAKNTLARRAAVAAGADALLALLEGPTAIAFVDTGGDPVAVAKALADTAKETKILSLRGGVLAGRAISGMDVEELAKLPPADVVKAQVLGVIIAPVTQLLALLQAPVQNLVGLIDARIEQLGGGAAAVVVPAAPVEVESDATTEPDGTDEPQAEVAEDPQTDNEEPATEPDES